MLSEQQLVDCSGSYGNYGCNGGLMDNAFQYVIACGGVMTAASYPYNGNDGNCKFDRRNIGCVVVGYRDVTSGSESALTDAIVIEPVATAIDASHRSFQFYSSGVYYEPACSDTMLDHGVLVVGYDKDSYFVKNSWGVGWGNNGYIYMARNRNNNCGIATMASYPIV